MDDIFEIFLGNQSKILGNISINVMIRVELETDWKKSISIKSYNEQTLFSVSKKRTEKIRSNVKYIISEFRIEIFFG